MPPIAAVAASRVQTGPAQERGLEGASIIVKEESKEGLQIDVPPDVVDAPTPIKAEPADQDQISPPTNMGGQGGDDADAARIQALKVLDPSLPSPVFFLSRTETRMH